MTVPFGDFESRLLDLIDRASFTATLGSVQNQRLVFGGTRGSGGGEGGPIQPFIGKLPQTEVTFDTDEFASLTIPSGENASLLDNLNRIRIAWTIVPSGVDEQNYTVAGSGNLVEHLRGIDEALGSGWGYTIQDEGITLPRRHKLNFIGASVVAADNLGDDATDVTISVSGGGGGHVIQDEGIGLTQRTNLNFAGPTVVATDDAGNDATLVTISGSIGWPYSASVISVDLTDPDADYSTVSAAIAAAVSGDLILVGPGTHTVDDETLPDGVDLTGFGKDITILQTSTESYCLQVGDSSRVSDLTAQNTYSASSCLAIYMPVLGDNSSFERVKAIATNGGAFPAYGFYVWNAELIHCEAVASTTGSAYGLAVRGDSIVEVCQGRYSGTSGVLSSDVATAHADAVVYLRAPVLVNGTINIGWDLGTVIGEWRDAAGNDLVRGRVSEAVWPDHPLRDVDEGDHFRQNAGVFPTGWTETNAAAVTNTDQVYSFWYLLGTAADVAWDYRKQTGITVESLAANAWASFQFGPILYRDGAFAADVDYFFAIHGETAAAIDLTEYVRVHLWWDSANSLWKVRGESNNGGGETASAWRTLDPNPLHEPIFFRVLVRNNANKTCRGYIGSVYVAAAQSLLQSVNEITTWGQVYLRMHQTRGAGVQDYLFVGAVDYLLNEA